MNVRIKVVLVVLWIAMTAPLVLLGFGSDNDAWRVARAADEIWKTGHYVSSRSTGFPIYEFLVTPAVRVGGWYLSNSLSLIFGLGLIAALFRLARSGEFKHSVVVVISIAFLPVVVKNAASTMDYIPALAILVWSYVALRERRWMICAVLIGIACGFRPTSGLYVVAAAAYALKKNQGWRSALRMIGVATLVGVAAYSPALIASGIPNPFSSIKLDLKTIVLIGGYNGLQLLGIIQSMAIAVVLIWYFRRTRRVDPSYFRSPHFAFHMSVILLWLFLYMAMPYESAYLLPAVPSLIFIIDRLVTGRTFAVLAILLVSFHILQLDVLAGESGRREIELSIRDGSIIDEIEDRRFRLSTRRAATHCTLDQPTVLMFGETWIPTVNDRWTLDAGREMYRRMDAALFVSEPILDEARAKALVADGFRLVVWEGAKWEYVRGGFESWREYVDVVDDLSLFFGTPIEGRWKSERRRHSGRDL